MKAQLYPGLHPIRCMKAFSKRHKASLNALVLARNKDNKKVKVLDVGPNKVHKDLDIKDPL